MKYFISILSLLFSLSAMGQLNPQPKKITEKFFPDPELEINTPAFQKKKGFTDYEEMMDYLNDLQSKHPELMSISFIGESQKGKKIPMVKLAKAGVEDPVRVWIQGGLHGNEPGSTESIFFLMVNLLEDKTHEHLLDRLSLAIVPMANIDGYERHDRYAANGLDLNRDQTKFSNPESIYLKEAFNAFNPEVALDLHEYNAFRKHYSRLSTFGITSAYDAMFLYTGNLNVPENMRKLTDEVFVEKARRSLNQHYLRHHPYFSTTEHLGEIQLRQGATSPRSSATSYALTNCVSTLLEVRGVKLGRTSFKRRVYSAYLVSRSFLQTAYEEKEQLRKEIQRANLNRDEAVIESDRAVYEDSIEVIDLNTREIMPFAIKVRDGLKMTATKKRVRPFAYVIPKGEEAILKRLRILGLELHELNSDLSVDLDTYEVTEYQQEAEKFEDIHIQNVKSEIRNQKTALQAGDFVLIMDQQRSNLAIEVLEPEAKNGFVAYEVVPTEMGATLPYYRCTQTDAFESIKKLINND